MDERKILKLPALLFASASAGLPLAASAGLNISDPSIITLYRLNEQTSGQLENSPPAKFFDTAPTGIAQDHNDFFDGASDGPAWGTGATFMSGATTVGDGIGLTFTRSDNDHTRLQPLLNDAQGNYSNGESFSLMFRVNPASLVDNNLYILGGHSSNYLALEGTSQGGRVNVRLREGVGGGETDWQFNSFGADATGGEPILMSTNTWYNVFLMYEANTSITLAVDDGTTFKYRQTTTVPDGFDTLANGYADAGVSWGLATYSVGLAPISPFDGSMESMVMWDKALTIEEAQAIGLTNLGGVPGDFNNDSVVNVQDIDLLCQAIRGEISSEGFDVNGDTQVNNADLTHEVVTIIGTELGDSDLDDDVDLSDLGNLATNYEQPPIRTWGQGDFDCDGDVDLADLGTLATNYDTGTAAAHAEFTALTGVEVPEPAIASIIAVPACLLATRKRMK